MALIVIGLLILGMGLYTQKFSNDSRFTSVSKIIRNIGILILLIGLLNRCIVQIEAGTVGVKSLFGKVQLDVLFPGLHVINPLIKVTQVESRTQNYTMSEVHDEGQKLGDDAIRALTKDGLEIVIDLTVLYRVKSDEAPIIINEIGSDYQDKIVRPIARSKIRDHAVYYEAVDLYSSKREEFQQNIFKSIENDFGQRGLILEQILIRNIALPQSVKHSIEEKIRAEQESQKMQFVLQKEKQEADRKRIEAQGIADYQKIINTGLTDKQLMYERIKALKDLSLSPNSKVIVTNSNNNPILINSNN